MAGVKLKLKKGDDVIVTAGKDKGKKGKIIQIITSRQRVMVEKINVVSRHLRQSAEGGGGIMEKEAPIHISNVKYLCGKCNEPVRIMRKLLQDGKSVRACKKCGEILDK